MNLQIPDITALQNWLHECHPGEKGLFQFARACLQPARLNSLIQDSPAYQSVKGYWQHPDAQCNRERRPPFAEYATPVGAGDQQRRLASAVATFASAVFSAGSVGGGGVCQRCGTVAGSVRGTYIFWQNNHRFT